MGFLPSSNGFGFDNSWPDQPSWVLTTPLGPLGVGNDSGGLCGGMVFGAMDHFLAARPTLAARPPAGTAMHAFLVRRLVDSWHLPSGVARYYRG